MSKFGKIQTVNVYQSTWKIKIIQFLLFWILIKLSKWMRWAGDIYPIIHGGYYANINGDTELQEYPYCHAQYMSVDQIVKFSNEDLLFRYIANFVYLSSELNLNGTGALVRLDAETGKTIWAK